MMPDHYYDNGGTHRGRWVVMVVASRRAEYALKPGLRVGV